jgi:hypothetical protein
VFMLNSTKAGEPPWHMLSAAAAAAAAAPSNGASTADAAAAAASLNMLIPWRSSDTLPLSTRQLQTTKVRRQKGFRVLI